VASNLEKQLAQFLRKQRGDMTFVQFSRKVGLPPSTLFRLENGQQSITLGKMEQVLTRLKCKLTDVFKEGS
jgi:predicted transcriptional regulator